MTRKQKKIWFILIPVLLETIGSGYLLWIQDESQRNMKIIEDHFISACKGFEMMPFESPIEVNACGKTYYVKVEGGKLVILKTMEPPLE